MDKFEAFRMIFGWAPCPNCDNLLDYVNIRKDDLINGLEKIITALEDKSNQSVGIFVNGASWIIPKKPLTRTDIVQLAGYPPNSEPTVTFQNAENVETASSNITGRTDGCLAFNDTRMVYPKDGTHFTVVYTGNA